MNKTIQDKYSLIMEIKIIIFNITILFSKIPVKQEGNQIQTNYYQNKIRGVI